MKNIISSSLVLAATSAMANSFPVEFLINLGRGRLVKLFIGKEKCYKDNFYSEA